MVEPALTPEEWADFFHAMSYPDHWGVIEQKYGRKHPLNEWGGEIGNEQAISAMCLHDRTFGFTHDDVTLLNCEAMNSEDNNCPAEAAMFQSLADRIEALLPPEEA